MMTFMNLVYLSSIRKNWNPEQKHIDIENDIFKVTYEISIGIKHRFNFVSILNFFQLRNVQLWMAYGQYSSKKLFIPLKESMANIWHLHGHDASFQHTLNQTWIARSTDAKQSFKVFIFIVYVHNNMYLGAYEYGA